MTTQPVKANRRTFLVKLTVAGAIGLTGLEGLVCRVLAMGDKQFPQGIRKVAGDVRINGASAEKGSPVQPGDEVTTGADSMALFVVGTSAYLLRDHSRMFVGGTGQSAAKKAARALRVLNGKMLAVFGRGKKRIITPTAVAGIRGSAVYVEAEPQRTYICTCYGDTDLRAVTDPGQNEQFTTKYHEAPRYIYAQRTGGLIETAPVINHTDDELILLETLVGRKPPFVKPDGTGTSSY